jgi:hypothetical protein
MSLESFLINTEEINVINLTATLQNIARGVTFFWPPTVQYCTVAHQCSILYSALPKKSFAVHNSLQCKVSINRVNLFCSDQ